MADLNKVCVLKTVSIEKKSESDHHWPIRRSRLDNGNIHQGMLNAYQNIWLALWVNRALNQTFI